MFTGYIQRLPLPWAAAASCHCLDGVKSCAWWVGEKEELDVIQ